VRPDFICLSKGLTGGVLPLSCVLTTDDVYAAFWDDRTTHGFLHSHSYTGNPLACRAALAVLDTFEREPVLARNAALASAFTTLLAPLSHHPRVRAARHLGMIWAWDIDTQDPGFAMRYHRAALNAGLLLRPIGNTLYLMPPYCLTDADQQFAAERMVQVLEHVLADIDQSPTPNASTTASPMA
jgi:adenosylmethionine-8-amino-7-oxononanoate aminotransferase